MFPQCCSCASSGERVGKTIKEGVIVYSIGVIFCLSFLSVMSKTGRCITWSISCLRPGHGDVQWRTSFIANSLVIIISYHHHDIGARCCSNIDIGRTLEGIVGVYVTYPLENLVATPSRHFVVRFIRLFVFYRSVFGLRVESCVCVYTCRKRVVANGAEATNPMRLGKKVGVGWEVVRR